MSERGWREGVPLAPLTSWRIGGAARALAAPGSPEELTGARREAERRGWPVFLLGGGTNLLIADEGYPGLVLRCGGRSWTIAERRETALLRAEARVPLAHLARAAARAGWKGLEWAEGIPGTVAGAAVCNAGAYGGEIARVVDTLEIVHPDGRCEDWPAEAMEYRYRSSVLKESDPAGPAVLAVRFRLQRADPRRLLADLDRIAAERQARTPDGSTCGSVFRNPPGSSAGELIDRAGCKGLRAGAAVVSDLHANFIINEGGASARDVRTLIEEVRTRVRDLSGISLELEIQLVGFRDDG